MAELSATLTSRICPKSIMAQRVLIHGATGETGGDILDGLIEDGDFVGSPNPLPK